MWKKIVNWFKKRQAEFNRSKSTKITRLRIWMVLFIGVILILISLLYPEFKIQGIKVSELIRQMGRTFVAASIIALLLRVPVLLNDVNNAAVNLLRNNLFLKRLTVDELKELRMNATEQAYLKSANSANSSLKEIDSQISNLFLEPYYKSFRIVVRCYQENGFIRKKITTTFTLKNPKLEKCNATKHLKSRVICQRIEDKSNEELRSIKKIQAIIDNEGDWNDLSSKIVLTYDDYEEESSPYNMSSHLVRAENEAPSILEFKDNIQIKIMEERLVQSNDNTYIHRVDNPVENFNINYSFMNNDVDLIGNCFGTFQDTKDGGIDIVKDSNSINISTSKWLLNGNGIIIVHNNIV